MAKTSTPKGKQVKVQVGSKKGAPTKTTKAYAANSKKMNKC
jgi:hypothetical protein